MKKEKIRQHGWHAVNKEEFLERWERDKPDILKRPALPPPKRPIPEGLDPNEVISEATAGK